LFGEKERPRARSQVFRIVALATLETDDECTWFVGRGGSWRRKKGLTLVDTLSSISRYRISRISVEWSDWRRGSDFAPEVGAALLGTVNCIPAVTSLGDDPKAEGLPCGEREDEIGRLASSSSESADQGLLRTVARKATVRNVSSSL